MKYFHTHHISFTEDSSLSTIAFYDDVDDPIDFIILSQGINHELILTLNDTDCEFINVIEEIKVLHQTAIVKIKSEEQDNVDYDYIEIEFDEPTNDIRSFIKKVCHTYCTVS
ncbi:hypothetical protein [Acinetobacter pollinis]|uniref:hypothetical protein n=1 Tax=Acinetobacter pollinis TaxID=2605270 RepID=UPI0018A2C34A|nr:hypothetical protein [Acinetobacter pollinis]